MSKKIIPLISLFLFFIFIARSLPAQEKHYKVACIAFYNLENFYDTIDDPNKDDQEFLPGGSSKWNTLKFLTKLNHTAEVVSQIGDELVKKGPDIMGFSEIENRQILIDIINTPELKKEDYGIAHYDSPDKRGVDVGLIYKKKNFTLLGSRPHRLTIPDMDDFFTRDILEVSGLLDGDKLYILVNHWPSRSKGEVQSAPLRAAAASLCRSIVDSLLKVDPNSKIIIMGDLNDDPTDASLVKYLKAKGKAEKLKPGELYNPMWKLFNNGIGSLAYRDSWNLFDQFVITPALLNPPDSSGFRFLKAKVFNKKFLTQSDGQYAGYPFRTYAGGIYAGGYSDHFPIYIFLTKEVK